MDIKTMKMQDVKTRVYDAIEKAKQLQPKLNAVVTFVDVEEQLEALKQIPSDAPLYGIPVVLKDIRIE